MRSYLAVFKDLHQLRRQETLRLLRVFEFGLRDHVTMQMVRVRELRAL